MEYLNQLPAAVLFFGAIGAVVAAAGCLINIRWSVVAFGIMLFASSISYSVDPFTDTLIPTLFTPIQLYRNFIYIFGGGLCYLIIAAHAGKFVKNSVHPAGLLLAMIALYGGAVRVLSGHVNVGLLSIGLAVFSILPLVIVAPNAIQRRDQFFTFFRVILLVMGVWIIMNTVQFFHNPAVLYPADSGRFQGLTGNPQFAGVLFAFGTVVCSWIAINDPSKIVRFFAIASASALALCLVWSGSRTGFGMSVIGLCVIFASRMGQFVLLAPFGAIFAYIFLTYVLGDTVNIDARRLVSTRNTRGGSWGNLLQTIASRPLFGTGNPSDAGGSENSYLYAIASFGIFMAVIIGALMAVSGVMILNLFRKRRHEDKRGKAFTDLAIGLLLMYFAGALLEGYIISRVHSATVFFVIAVSVGRRILDTEPQSAEPEPLAPDTGHTDYAVDDWGAPEHTHPGEAHDTPRENVWDPADDWREAEPAGETHAYDRWDDDER